MSEMTVSSLLVFVAVIHVISYMIGGGGCTFTKRII